MVVFGGGWFTGVVALLVLAGCAVTIVRALRNGR